MARQEHCPICGAGMGPGSAACTACGEPREASPDAAERIRIGRRLDHLLSVLESLRRIYLVFAILLGGLFFLLLLFAGHAIRGDTLAMAIAVLLGLSASFNAVAAWDVYRHPRLWSLLLAIVATPLLLLSVVGILGAPTVPGILQTVLLALGTAGLWYGAIQVLNQGALLRSHPDLSAALRLRSKERRLPEGTASRRMREKGRIEDAGKRRHVLVYGGGALGAALLAAMLIYGRLHPALEPVVDSFRASWNARDWAAVKGRFEPSSGERMGKGLDVLLKRRGWLDAPPALPAGTISGGGRERTVAVFPVEAGEIRTDWKLLDGTWYLAGIRLPER